MKNFLLCFVKELSRTMTVVVVAVVVVVVAVVVVVVVVVVVEVAAVLEISVSSCCFYLKKACFDVSCLIHYLQTMNDKNLYG